MLCRRTYRRAARCTTTWACGDGAARWPVSITLYVACRDQAGREASPTAAIIDSQSVKSAKKGGASIDPNGYDAGKRIKGKKCHVLVEIRGLMLRAIVHAADIQDRNGAGLLISTLFSLHPLLTRLEADVGYQGPRFADAVKQAMGQMRIEIVKRSELRRFVVLPKRWLAERTIAWLNRCRRLATDWENRSYNALAFLRPASIRLMLRKRCNPA